MSISDLLPNKGKTNKKTTVKPSNDSVIPRDYKDYHRVYISVETLDLLYDVIQTKKQTDDYSINDAIYDGLKALSKDEKLIKAPENIKKVKKRFIINWKKKNGLF